jgi:antitoxin (DNA-binding transcriptional repressor) of toxin-antitoxin stability system
MSSATVRDLRNRFPQVRKLVEASGEVVLTERGVPRYRLALYTQAPAATPPAMDYWSRLCGYQPRSLSKAQSAALRAASRGER